jgi:segregation and condensation protein A
MEGVIKKKLDYSVRLQNFEGPLDLLLYLIKEAKIDIKDIFISQVTEQYILYMSQIGTLDMDKASEFLEIAATLLEIKSNSLLPKIEDILFDTDDPAQVMIKRLEEYKIFKESCEKLKLIENVNRYYKAPDDSVYNVTVVLKDMDLENLITAFSKLLIKAQQKKRDIEQPREIERDPFTVDEKIEYIKEILQIKKTISFIDLFSADVTKNEIITTFQALLELIREQYVTVSQKAVYDDILITYAEDKAVG